MPAGQVPASPIQQSSNVVKRLRVAHLRLFVPFILLAWRASQPIGDNSFLWHVRAGTVQLDAGIVLSRDPFSFTAAGEPWRTQSWLVELAYGWLEQMTGGIGWVPAMKFIAMSVTVGLVGMAIHRVGRGRSALTLGAVLLLVWQAIPFGVARPALIGSMFLAVVVAICHVDRRPLWLLPILFWLWASIHGMFVIGLGYVFLDGLRRRSRRQVIAVAFSGLATGLTAHGFGAWWILVQFLRNRGALDLISEWDAPDFSNPFVLPFLVVILGVIVAATVGETTPGDLWIIVPFISFGLLAQRNIWPAVIVLLPIAARGFNARPVRERSPRSESVPINWVIAVVLVVVAGIGVTRPASLREDLFPPAAAIDALDAGPLFNGSAVGGYLIYADWPEHDVFIDDRAELYGEDGLRRFLEVKSAIGVAEVFAELGIEQAIATADWPIVEYLELLGWSYRYEDENFVVMASS